MLEIVDLFLPIPFMYEFAFHNYIVYILFYFAERVLGYEVKWFVCLL